MKVKAKTTQTINVELEPWEALKLKKLLSRIEKQPSVSKSEFSMSEKVVGKNLVAGLRNILEG